MARQAKDIAKRLRFHLFPRPDTFRRWFLVAGLAAVGLGLGLWFLFTGWFGERQYLPEFVSASHATFGKRCENCHDQFRPVANGKCLTCHAERVHSQFETETPACRKCHVEHRRADVFLSVSTGLCVDCHGDLHTKREPAGVAQKISGFANHPELTPFRDGHKDQAALRFNHSIHMTSPNIPKDDQLKECAKCHVLEPNGRYMKPIVFEDHCKRCHAQKVSDSSDVPFPMNSVEAPHDDPKVVREGLESALVVLAVERPDIFKPSDGPILPGRVERGAVDESKSLKDFEKKWVGILESKLYQPFQDTPPLLDNNKNCFLCHVEAKPAADGGFPEIAKTNVPHRWLERGEFSHRKHDKVACESCHPKMNESKLTSDTNLPKRELCQRCHVDGSKQSAGTNCMLCHLYHDTSKKPELRKPKLHEQGIEALLGDAALKMPAAEAPAGGR